MHAIATTTVISLLLALVNIRSTAGFEAIISLVVITYYSSFTLSAVVMLKKNPQLQVQSCLGGPFRLGRAGVPITVAANACSVVGAFFALWPTKTKPDVQDISSCVIVLEIFD